MKPKRSWKLRWFVILGAMLIGVPAWATNAYVSVPGTVTPQSPYTNWLIAATNIQDAIDAINTNGGNIVYVSNGVYYLTNQLVITKGIELRSWNQGVLDQTNTVLHGNNYTGKLVTNRCVYMAHPQARVAGFTITQGKVTNVSADINAMSGGGIFITNGGSVADCIVISNLANYTSGRGGGIYASSSTGIIERCVMSVNRATAGAGLSLNDGSNTVRNCTISFNSTQAGALYGGGAYIVGSANAIVECLVFSNRAIVSNGKGGGIALYNGACARNCLVFGNVANRNGGGVMLISAAGQMENCTVTSNTCSSSDDGGGIYNANGTAWVMVNSIVYGNIPPGGGTNADVGLNVGTMVFSNNCSSTDLNALRPGTNTGNITTAPQFVDTGAYDYRLDRASPCVNTGANRDWMNNATDLQGYRRIMEGIVDMGAYEFRPPGGAVIIVR